MKALIIEDEKSSALRLKKLILKHEKAKNFNLHFAQSLDEAATIISKENFDLIFLDLNLNNGDGFSLLKELVSQTFLTIVVSAYTDRALEAFEIGVLDFIPKPIFEERLNKALDRFFSRSRSSIKAKNLFVKSGNKVETVLLDGILYFQPADRYSEIILENGSKKLHHLTLDKIIKILPDNFERVHRSYIANMDFVERIYTYSGSQYEIELKNKTKLPLSRTYFRKIKLIFENKKN